MATYYIDESGFTGEDLLAPDQPLFTESTNNFSLDEANIIIETAFGRVDSKELKYSRLSRKGRHYDGIVELVRLVASDPSRAGIWVSNKEYAMVTFIVDWWIEPLAHKHGLNLYKDGANHGMANMLFLCLQGFWSNIFRRKILLRFQRMFRTRSTEKFKECQALVRNELRKVSDYRAEILRYLWEPFPLLGFQHIRNLPPRVLDLALPGLVLIGQVWRERHQGPWEVVHDQSSNMAAQKWLWDALSSPTLASAKFENPGGVQNFPMNVTATRFGNSVEEKQLQICDILAGAASACLRIPDDAGTETIYRDRLVDAGIKRLIIGGLWPSAEVTPEALGKEGWDGNIAIEWIAEQLRRHGSGPGSPASPE